MNQLINRLLMVTGSWLLAQGSWLMAKERRPGPEPRGAPGPGRDLGALLRALGPGWSPVAISHEP